MIAHLFSTDTNRIYVPNNKDFFGTGTVPLRISNKDLLIESQAANGLKLWSTHFSKIIWANPVIPEHIAGSIKSIEWVPVSAIRGAVPIQIFPLPWVYDLQFLKIRRIIRQQLFEKFTKSRYSHFALSSWNGGWGRQAALAGIKTRYPFSIHLETLGYNVRWKQAKTFKKKLKQIIDYPLVRSSDNKILKNAAVVQCNGMDTYRYYAPLCRNPKLIHDIHTNEDDLITEDKVMAKQKRLIRGLPLRIRYLGRIIKIKGPLEWLKVLIEARSHGVEFNAVWMGEGEMENDLKLEISKMGLSKCISIIPYVSNRKTVRQFLEDTDIFLFTHLSLESSRVQKEALNHGAPIVGFYSAFAEELVSKAGGGVFSPMGNIKALARLIAELDRDRLRLSELISRAAQDGGRFSGKKVFAERANSIKTAIEKIWDQLSQ